MNTQIATVAELEAARKAGKPVSLEEFAKANSLEAAAVKFAAIDQEREQQLALESRSADAVEQSKPLHAEAERIAAKPRIRAAQSLLKDAVKEWFAAVNEYNSDCERLRATASQVAAIEPTAPTGITIRADTLIVGEHNLLTIDPGTETLLYRVEDAVREAFQEASY